MATESHEGRRTFVGFGFGAIQAGLFLYEAYRTGRFARLVVAEVLPDVVDAVRRGGGRYTVNVATRAGVERNTVEGLTILNPRVAGDRAALVDAVRDASEICTALPSVQFFGSGKEGDVVDIIGRGLKAKDGSSAAPRAIVYTAENHNHAGEILEEALARTAGKECMERHCRCLNTVIGKMSGVVTDGAALREQGLAPFVEGIDRAFLVEEFNRILIGRITWPDFERSILVFQEKPDMLPFEEAKLYGHNATHALIGYLLRMKGRQFMAEAREEPGLLESAREAFIAESGGALCRKHAGLDPLFTPGGYREYVDDLIDRMMNPHLRDSVERVTRDTRRKLGWDDRLIGTMRLALGQGIAPKRYATGAAAALRALAAEEKQSETALLRSMWLDAGSADEREAVVSLLTEALASRP